MMYQIYNYNFHQIYYNNYYIKCVLLNLLLLFIRLFTHVYKYVDIVHYINFITKRYKSILNNKKKISIVLTDKNFFISLCCQFYFSNKTLIWNQVTNYIKCVSSTWWKQREASDKRAREEEKWIEKKKKSSTGNIKYMRMHSSISTMTCSLVSIA